LGNQISTECKEKKIELFEYPNELKKIFEFLQKNRAKPILVGGYVRDTLLQSKSAKDIDVEVYNIDSYKKLTQLLAPFGSVTVVGESFGVCILQTKSHTYDFSLPRRENKTGKSHKDFTIQTNPSLTFKEASQRRDFTVNALGYDADAKVLIDCWGGLDDLKNKLSRCVDTKSFIEDPLRILRAMQLSARLEFSIEPKLFKLCKTMVQQGELRFLPKERIYDEFRKLFLKSAKPSIGICFLQKLQEKDLLDSFYSLNPNQKKRTLKALDNLAKAKIDDELFFWAALLFFLKDPLEIIKRFTDAKMLQKNLVSLIKAANEALTLCYNGYDDYALRLLSTKYAISDTLLLLEALFEDMTDALHALAKQAQELGIYKEAPKPIATGTMLIQAGLTPSKEFKKILDSLYTLQLKGEKIDIDFIKKHYSASKNP